MVDWQRVIVGDAFRVQSRDFGHYRDLFLLWPFLLFTIAGLISVSVAGHSRRSGLGLLALALVSIVLAKKRGLLITGALGFCTAESLLMFFMKYDWISLAVAIPTGVLFVVLIRYLIHHKSSYQWPKGLTIADFLVGLSSILLTVLTFHWIGR